MTASKTPLTFLSLPYDIRFLIYQNLFPSSPQIYLQALPDHTVIAILAEGQVATNILLTCHAIYNEAAGYLYNTYLFNVIGRKEHCLRSHTGFLQTLQKHAHQEVHVSAFSNGTHSETMCISMHTGDAKMAMLERRGRGVEMTLAEIQKEVRAAKGGTAMLRGNWTASVVSIFIASLLAVLFGYVLQLFVSAPAS